MDGYILKNNLVAIVGFDKDIGNTTKKCISLLDGLKIRKSDNVIIKPNLCNSKNPHGMVNTSFKIIKELINLLKKTTDNITVVESNNISGSAKKRMVDSGLLDMLKKLDVNFLNLSEDEHETHEIAGQTLYLPKTIIEADRFINMPKIKTCGHTLVTLSMKNLFGLLVQTKKNKFHKNINEILPYLVKKIRQDLILVDGVVAMEGNGPLIGTPIDLGVILAGFNSVSVDSVCSRIMGYEPKEIIHIKKAYDMGLGEINLNKIEIIGEDWEKFVKKFQKPYSIKATIRSFNTFRKLYFP